MIFTEQAEIENYPQANKRERPVEKYVSVDEMVAIEREADSSGLTYDLMMENAGNNLANAVENNYSTLKDRGILWLVGSGNNGGDTVVALSRLSQLGWRPRAYLARPRRADDPLIEKLRQSGGEIYTGESNADFSVLSHLLISHAVILDGVLGTGVRLPLKKEVSSLLDLVQKTVADLEDIHVVAVDCPSGVDCDLGSAAPECIPAELTVTMAAVKRGLLSFPSYNMVGRLQTVGIGLGEKSPMPEAWEKIKRIVPDRDWVAHNLLERPLDAHKGTFGTALVIAGSINYTGAALLAGRAAYRAGAGLVSMAVPEPIYIVQAGHFPEATWLILPDEVGVISKGAWHVVAEQLQRATAVLVGPGFGLEETTKAFLSDLLTDRGTSRRGSMSLVPSKKPDQAPLNKGLPPLVIDADGLKLLSRIQDWQKHLPPNSILTPHPGEMSILTGVSKDEIQKDRVSIAERFAKDWGHVVILKGAFSVVASPGGDTAVIPIATPALARAGTGDVLAGLIVGLRAQGTDAWQAAVAGAWIHAEAGLHAAKRLGSTAAVLAGDVLESVVSVMADLHY